MLRLELSETLGRPIRKDPWPELTMFTSDRIKGALTAGRPDEASALADYLVHETGVLRDGFPNNHARLCTLIARHFGEDAFFDLLYRLPEVAGLYGELIPAFRTVQEFVWFWAEYKRSQRTDFTITEEPDRYVFRYGSRPLEHTSLAAGMPAMAEASRPYDWTWNRPRVPYYVARLCIWGELYPARRFGWPLLISDWAGDEVVPSIRYVYKDPALIPAQYFDRIGVRRDPARFTPLGQCGRSRFRGKGLAGLPLADTDRPVPAIEVPAVIRHHPGLGRGMRQDALPDLSRYTNDLIKLAIERGSYPAAKALADYYEHEMRTIRLTYLIVQASFTTLIAQHAGEAEFHQIQHEWFTFEEPGRDKRYGVTVPKTGSVDELAQFRIETKRGQGYRFHITDDGNRYTVHFGPCGTGGILRTLRTEDGKPAPYMDRTKGAYPWAFARPGIPYYCVHCWQGGTIGGTMRYGYPHYVYEFADVGDYTGACTEYIYKTPEAVPAEVFRRMGIEKDPARFRPPYQG